LGISELKRRKENGKRRKRVHQFHHGAVHTGAVLHIADCQQEQFRRHKGIADAVQRSAAVVSARVKGKQDTAAQIPQNQQ